MEITIRSLCKQLVFVLALLPTFVATGAFAASIEWQSMQGRERVIISKAMSDGMSNDISRIDAKGIAIPFAKMPGGLILSEQPEGASIIQGTTQLGQTLVILTQTPKFGFVVSQRTPTRVVIDFFPDELGARWKRGDEAPLQSAQTGQAPQTEGTQATVPATAPLSSGAPSSQAEENPGAATPPQAGQGEGPQSLSRPSSATAPGARPIEQHVGASATPIGWKEQPVPTNAPVLTADGTRPATGQTQTSPIPVVSIPESAPPATPLPENILLDTRQDTASRSASLPAPGLDVSLAGQAANSQHSPLEPQETSPTPAQEARGHQTPSPLGAGGQNTPSAQAPSLGTAQNMPASQEFDGAQAPNAAPVHDVVQVPDVVQIPDVVQLPEDSSDEELVAGKRLLRGAFVPVSPHNYQGLFNPLGIEGIEGEIPPDALGAFSPSPPQGEQQGAVPPTSGAVPLPENMNAHEGVEPASATPPQTSLETARQVPLPSPQASALLIVEDPPVAVQGERGSQGELDRPQAPPARQTGQPGREADASSPAVAGASPSAPVAGQETPMQAATETPSESDEQATATDILNTSALLENDEDVIYVNEAGEEIIPPADPELRLQEIRSLMAERKYAEANELVTALLGQTNLTKPQRENALHIRAEALFFLHRDNLQQYGASVSEATDLAINANPRSPKNAVALLRLGYINLQLENVPEAEARFNMLRRMFPNDENVPLSYYYWGDYFYNHDDLERAIDQFQVVTQKYPESKYAREASLGLARSFYRLGYYEQAFNIVEYIEQRWPRFYLNYPPFLNMMGDVGFRLNNFDFATRYYWLYVNLEPEGEEVDVILTRIGDIYSLQQQSVAAREVYSEVVERFPDTDGGLIALMRLAEESINDDPTLATMFNAFDSRPVLSPVDVYKKIINDYPQSKYVSLAQLKLAMWHLWNHDYTTTLDIADTFLQTKPQDDLAPKMKEVALKTFAVLSAQSVANGSFSRMRDIWEAYPMLQDQKEILTPESRVALGVSYWKDGLPREALGAVEPFFLGDKIPEYSEMALNLVLQIYLQYEQWPAIEEVARRVSLWEIKVDNQLQLDYALALAREKMGKPDEAAVLWEKLYDSKRLPDDQMAFATYFLARDAEKRQRNDEAYLLGVEALKRLQGEAEKNPEQADTAKIKTQISSLMSLTEEGGRLGESLEYAEQYMQYLPEGDPDRAGVLFRMARINKKQGNEALWRERMTEVARLYPDTVYGQTASAALKSTDLEKAASAYAPKR